MPSFAKEKPCSNIRWTYESRLTSLECVRKYCKVGEWTNDQKQKPPLLEHALVLNLEQMGAGSKAIIRICLEKKILLSDYLHAIG